MYPMVVLLLCVYVSDGCIFLFAGWISIDQTLLGHAMGYRAVYLTNDTETLLEMDALRAKSSAVLKCACTIIRCVVWV